MSKFLIDVTRLVDRLLKGRLPTGVDRVNLEYVRYYGPGACALVRWRGRSFVFSVSCSQALFHWLSVPASRAEAYSILARGMIKSWRSRPAAGSILFNNGHTGLEQQGYAAMIQQQKLRPFFMVHDLIPISHPEFCRPGERQKHLARMRTVMGSAAGIVCNSQATQDELSALARRENLALPPSIVALLAPGITAVPVDRRPMDAPYFVILGTIEPRKNHLLLLQVWRCLSERLGDRTPRLVLIGQRGWECENAVDMLERCEQLKGLVTELTSCTDDELASWLRHARALLFPSFAEGYGLPLVEALSFGTPVIASDLKVFREIAGDVPEYLDPLDGLGWMAMIERYLDEDSRERNQQLGRMGGFAAPTWNDHFKRVDALLEQVGR